MSLKTDKVAPISTIVDEIVHSSSFVRVAILPSFSLRRAPCDDHFAP